MIEAYAADDLLRAIPRDPLAPHYTERRWREKELAARKRALERPFVSRGLAFDASEILSMDAIGDVVRESYLSIPQGLVFAFWLDGFSFLEIAAFRGTSKQASHQALTRAFLRVRKAYGQYAFAGLSSLYAEETRYRTSEAPFL